MNRKEVFDSVIKEEERLKKNAKNLRCFGDEKGTIYMIKGYMNKSFYDKTATEILAELNIDKNFSLKTIMNKEHLIYQLNFLKEVNRVLETPFDIDVISNAEAREYIQDTITIIGKNFRSNFKEKHKNKEEGTIPISNLLYINSKGRLKKALKNNLKSLDEKSPKELEELEQKAKENLKESILSNFKDSYTYEVCMDELNQGLFNIKQNELYVTLRTRKEISSLTDKVLDKYYITALEYARKFLDNSIVKYTNPKSFYRYYLNKLYQIGKIENEVYIEDQTSTLENGLRDTPLNRLSIKTKKSTLQITEEDPNQLSMFDETVNIRKRD